MAVSSKRDKQGACAELVRNKKTGLGELRCGETLTSGKCPNRDFHIHKYRTGFCIDGHCEGTEKKTRNGAYQKTCIFWLTCPCECHTNVSTMYLLAKAERKLPILKYAPEHHDFVMPSREEVYAEIRAREAELRPEVVLIKPEGPGLPVRTMSHPPPAPDARRVHRGQLEELVLECIEDWVKGGKKEFATTKYVAAWIENKYSYKNTSRGAIDAVFKRWQDIGFAFIAVKPTRFAGYTKTGLEKGLRVLKKERLKNNV